MQNPNYWFGDVYKDDKFARLRILTYAKLLGPYLKSGNRLLDIGCYTAQIYDYLPKDVEYLGLDFDEEALKIAAAKGAKVKNVRFDEDALNIDGKFDIIVAAEVLEHVKNPEAMLGQIKNLLSKDGVVLVSLPNECTLYHRLMCLAGIGIDMYAFKLYKHLHLPTISQSRGFIRSYFDIIKEAYYVNPSGKGSRWEGLGKVISKIPYSFWLWLARICPGLFARGIIFLCKNKSINIK